MKRLADLRNGATLEQGRTLLIGHRGAVGSGVPENSLAALHGAARTGYDLVEIDVASARDGVPVLFHSDRAGTMWMNCGIDAAVGELTNAELRAVRYRASDQHVPTLDEALALCTALRLGVVLDLKTTSAPGEFLALVGDLVQRHGLSGAALLLSEDAVAQEALAGRVMPMVARQHYTRAKAGEAVALSGRFWPAFADRLSTAEVAALRERGALVLATVAPRLYPVHAHRELARDDVGRLVDAGVHAFLIDDVYRDLFPVGNG